LLQLYAMRRLVSSNSAVAQSFRPHPSARVIDCRTNASMAADPSRSTREFRDCLGVAAR